MNLLVDLADSRFSQDALHHELEALDRRGIYPLREHRTPERILGWIDGEFGGAWSSEAALGGLWIASEADRPLGFAAYDTRGLRYHWLRAWTGKSSVGVFGPLGVIAGFRGRGLGGVLARAALFSLRERGYRRALIPAVAPSAVPFYERQAGAWVVETFDAVRKDRRWRATVLASGHGSNFQAVLDASARGEIPLDVTSLVTNRPNAYALTRAAEAGVATHVERWLRDGESRESYDARLMRVVAETEPDIVLLLGWMHVLPATFIARFPQLLNVHPAFLPLDPTADVVTMPDGSTIPAFRGAHAFDDALAAGSKWAGASVHRVNVAVDRGTIVARAPLRIDGTSPGELEERLHALEHRVLSAALARWCWEQR